MKFWYDYIKLKYQNNAKLCYMDTDSFFIHIKTEHFYKDIVDDVENGFDTLNYKVDRPLPKGKNGKGSGLMKDELGEKIMTKLAASRSKAYSYIDDDDDDDDDDDNIHKRAKGTKKCVIKKMLKFYHYRDCIFDKKSVLQSQKRFKSETHNLYPEKVNKIGLS